MTYRCPWLFGRKNRTLYSFETISPRSFKFGEIVCNDYLQNGPSLSADYQLCPTLLLMFDIIWMHQDGQSPGAQDSEKIQLCHNKLALISLNQKKFLTNFEGGDCKYEYIFFLEPFFHDSPQNWPITWDD